MTRPLDITAVAAFSEEVRTSTPAILEALDAAERDRTDSAAVHEVYRLVHALKGAASMVGLAAFGYLLNQAEELLDTAVTERTPLSDDLVALLREEAPQFVAYVDAAAAGRPADPVAIELARVHRAFTGQPENGEDVTLRELLDIERHGLAGQAHRCAEAPASSGAALSASSVAVAEAPAPVEAPSPAAAEPAPALEEAEPDLNFDLDLAPSEPLPAELAEVFAQETQEQLQVVARLTTGLLSSPDDRESLQELRRAVHTIKGAAGVVGYKAASRLAHRMEDQLDRLYEGTVVVTPELSRLLVASSDALDDLIAGASDRNALRDALGRLFHQYRRLLGDAPPAEAVRAPEPAAELVAATEPETAALAPAGPRPVTDRRRGAQDRRRGSEDRRRGGAQAVRVPLQRLGDLVRLAGELVINRSTFDQHYAALGEQMEEVRLSAARLRRVAQKLETDYEVRALASSPIRSATPADAGGNGGHGFDELEFDRYTDFHLVLRELTETASDINTLSTRLGDTIGNFDGDLTRLGRLTREVQDKVMEFRMVPLSALAARLERAVRVTADECGKAVDLELQGETVALDKTLLEEMTDPLLHLLRNAVDHGIERPEVRRAAGKNERGRIAVSARHEGTDVLIEVFDDGAGLDLERIRRTAVQRGYLAEADAAAASPDTLLSLVFEPGFSTAQDISEVSGRGVGLDIVKAKVNRLAGRIKITSLPLAGTTVTVRVPMTMAITRILLVRAGGQLFGLPLGAVEQIVRPDPAAVTHVGAERVLTVGERTYPLHDLALTLGLPHAAEGAASQPPALIANLAGRHLALVVDEIVQSRDAVVKTLGSHLRHVPGIWGATLLGDGAVILILNPTDLVAATDAPQLRVAAPRPRVASSGERELYTILIVDDSISMRHVLSNTVKRIGWNPLQARDGVDALELLHRSSTPPDLILLDIEMPRMDGYEFLSTVRAHESYSGLPIVMLTSRGGDKHREKAIALGATDYIVKPFREEILIDNLTRLIRASHAGHRKAAS